MANSFTSVCDTANSHRSRRQSTYTHCLYITHWRYQASTTNARQFTLVPFITLTLYLLSPLFYRAKRRVRTSEFICAYCGFACRLTCFDACMCVYVYASVCTCICLNHISQFLPIVLRLRIRTRHPQNKAKYIEIFWLCSQTRIYRRISFKFTQMKCECFFFFFSFISIFILFTTICIFFRQQISHRLFLTQT